MAEKALPEKASPGDAWVAQSVKHLTLDFSSGHDLMVYEFESPMRLAAVNLELHFRSSVPLSLCPSPTHALSQKYINSQ